MFLGKTLSSPLKKPKEPFDKLRVSGKSPVEPGWVSAHAERVEAVGGVLQRAARACFAEWRRARLISGSASAMSSKPKCSYIRVGALARSAGPDDRSDLLHDCGYG